MHFCFGTWKPIFFGPSIKIYHMHEKQVCELTFRLANTYMLGLELGPKCLRKLLNWKKFAYILNDTEGAHFPQTWQLLQKSTKFQIVSWFHLYILMQPKNKIKWKYDVSEITTFCTAFFIYLSLYDYVVWCDQGR